MSRLVQRCQGEHCGKRVLGVSSFRKVRGGGRESVCRYCHDVERSQSERLREKLYKLRSEEGRLRDRAARVRRDRELLESQLRRGAA